MSRIALLLAIALVALAASAQSQESGGTIGIYADSLGASNEIAVAPFTSTPFYVLASPNLQVTGGSIFAASFRIKYLPLPELFITATANPASHVASGTPLTDESLPSPRGGAVIVWEAGNCGELGSTGMVLLYTMEAYTLGPVADVMFEVDRFDEPAEPPWPELYSCEFQDGLFRFPADGLHAVINGTTISVEDRAWGAIKQLFR